MVEGTNNEVNYEDIDVDFITKTILREYVNVQHVVSNMLMSPPPHHPWFLFQKLYWLHVMTENIADAEYIIETTNILLKVRNAQERGTQHNDPVYIQFAIELYKAIGRLLVRLGWIKVTRRVRAALLGSFKEMKEAIMKELETIEMEEEATRRELLISLMRKRYNEDIDYDEAIKRLYKLVGIPEEERELSKLQEDLEKTKRKLREEQND